MKNKPAVILKNLKGRIVGMAADPEEVKNAMKPMLSPDDKRGKNGRKERVAPGYSQLTQTVKSDLFKQIESYPKIAAYFTSRNKDYVTAAKYLTAEDILQMFVCAYLREYHPELKFFHYKSESKEGHVGSSKKRLLGVTPGVSDLLIQKPGYIKCLWIELKTGKNTTTQDQKEFIEFQKACGHIAYPCNDFKHAQFIISQFLRYATEDTTQQKKGVETP